MYTTNAHELTRMIDPQTNKARAEKWAFFPGFCAFFRPCIGFFPVLLSLLFLGALFWAKQQDPFSRIWFTVIAGNQACKCVAVLPKPPGQHPVIIYLHGSGGSLMTDGFELRQMAELGLAVVSLEYEQTNATAFAPAFIALQHYLARQPWADTNAIAWVGFSLGANRLWDLALASPAPPKLLVLISGRGNDAPASSIQHPASSIHCPPLLLIHGGQDEVFPVADTERFAARLQSNGVPVELKLLPGLAHGLEPERGVVHRAIGEYCLPHLSGNTNRDSVWQNYHSIARWQAEAPALLWFWIPAAGWVGCWIWRRWRRGTPTEGSRPTGSGESPVGGSRPTSSGPTDRLTRPEIVLRWLAAVLAIWAATETALHLVPPHFLVSDKTLALARRFSVPPKERPDFEALAGWPIWQRHKLQTLLDHVELAGYNRTLINWTLDNTNYQDYVLQPAITGRPDEQYNWRRPLWEEFYPRIRHESTPEDAACIVVRHLRERVTVLAQPGLSHAIPEIWLRQLTDAAGFQIIYVAALRSVGVPARLDSRQQAEFWTGSQWQPAPAPAIMTW